MQSKSSESVDLEGGSSNRGTPAFSPPSTPMPSSTPSLCAIAPLTSALGESRKTRYILVTFQVTAPTGFGESVFVVIEGEINNDEIPLLTSPDLYPLHFTEKPISLRAGATVSYRYCKYAGGKFSQFETRSQPRILNLDIKEITLVVKDSIAMADFNPPGYYPTNPVTVDQITFVPPPQPSSWNGASTANSPQSPEDLHLTSTDGILVCSFYLPCKLTRHATTRAWQVEMDENSIIFHFPNVNNPSLLDTLNAKYVGVPPCDCEILYQERDEVTSVLSQYSCIPVFMDMKTHTEALEYCQGTLHDVFHGFVDVYSKIPTKWWNPSNQKERYKSYLSAGNVFAETISRHYRERSMAWFHGYELVPALPYLAKKLHSMPRRFGLTIHSPFPSSEIFRTLSVRNELLRMMLMADVINFHLFEFLRHFATCARRVLGIDEEKVFAGRVELNVDGRTVALISNHGGLDTHRLPKVMPPHDAFVGITIVGLDYGGFLSNIRLKLLAFERLKEKNPHVPIRFLQQVIDGNWGGPGGGGLSLFVKEDLDDDEDERAACLHLGRPYARSGWGRAQCEVICQRIASRFGNEVIRLEVLSKVPSVLERFEFLALGDIFFQAPIKEGVNFFSFEFVLANERKWNRATGLKWIEEGQQFAPPSSSSSATEMMESPCTPPTATMHRRTDGFGVIAKEIIRRSSAEGFGVVPIDVVPPTSAFPIPKQKKQHRKHPVPVLVCSQFCTNMLTLTGAIRVNPFQVGSILKGLDQALAMGREERISRFQTNLINVKYRTLTRWAEYVLGMIKRISARSGNSEMDVVLGFVTTTRLVRPMKNQLPLDIVARNFNASKERRLFMLDYGGTTVEEWNNNNVPRPKDAILMPTKEMCTALVQLSSLPLTDVYIVSGRTREELVKAFASCGPRLGLVSEHASQIRHPAAYFGAWEHLLGDEERSVWMTLATNLMQVYTSRTNGTFVETKESMVLWQYRDADPDFGNTQAKELQQNLQHILNRFGVDVVKGKGYVEVRTAGCDKGFAGKTIFQAKPYDFVFCAGDDAADEPMFAYFESLQQEKIKVFTCGVGIQPTTKAKYQVENVDAVLHVLDFLQKNHGRTSSVTEMAQFMKKSSSIHIFNNTRSSEDLLSSPLSSVGENKLDDMFEEEEEEDEDTFIFGGEEDEE